jgi:Flp pilus assembly protein TadD
MSQSSTSEAWDHIHAGRFAEAASVVRVLIGGTDDQDHGRLLFLFGLLGSVLNSLGRHDDATVALRKALDHELHVCGSRIEANPHRYFLANQYVNFGQPELALDVIQVVPSGVGHVRCMLHITAAKALGALGRQNEARQAAAEALAAAPTDERRSDVLAEVGDLLEPQR